MRCLICGNEMNGCLCPRCGFDESLYAERYAMLADTACSYKPIWFVRDRLFRQLEEQTKEKNEKLSRAPRKSSGAYLEAMRTAKKLRNIAQNSPRRTLAAGGSHTVGICPDGKVVATGDNQYGQCNVKDWTDIIEIAAGRFHTVGLRADGTLVAVGNNLNNQCNVGDWQNIVSVAAGISHTVGLRTDGTVVAVGQESGGCCSVEKWSNVAAIAAGAFHTLGLRVNGRVVASGLNEDGQCDVENWQNVVSIAAGCYHSVGITQSSELLTTGYNQYGQCDLEFWEHIEQVAAGRHFTAGLSATNVILIAGVVGEKKLLALRKPPHWNGVTAVAAGWNHFVGLLQDGTVKAFGDNSNGQCEVGTWMLRLSE